MKSKFNRLFSRMLSNKGYTIDQTILIVAIIAILITLVIVTVGWQLINRSSGTKAGAQLKQIEDANGQFFSDQRIWPAYAVNAAGGTPTQNLQVLVKDSTLTWQTSVDQTRLKNLLPGFRLNGTAVQHSFGSGGTITQQVNKYNAAQNIGTDSRMVVQFTAVPLADAKEADRAIDGTEGYNVGRVIYSAANCLNATVGGNVTTPTAQPTTGVVNVCYAANTIG